MITLPDPRRYAVKRMGTGTGQSEKDTEQCTISVHYALHDCVQLAIHLGQGSEYACPSLRQNAVPVSVDWDGMSHLHSSHARKNDAEQSEMDHTQ